MSRARTRSLVPVLALLLTLALALSLAPAALAGDPTIPKNVTIFNADSRFYLLWDSVPGATSYVVNLWDGVTNKPIAAVLDTGEPTCSHQVMEDGTMIEGNTYVLSVQANNGSAAASTDFFVYEIMEEAGPFINDIPTDLQLFITDSGYFLYWSAVKDAMGYDIFLWDGVTDQLIGTIDEGDNPDYTFHVNEGLMIERRTYVLSVGAANGTANATTEAFVYHLQEEPNPFPGGPDTPSTPGAFKTFYPATLNQKMATRLGPNTCYSEELGTFPKGTPIQIIEQEMGNGVPWVLVDFWSNNLHYRAYTGLKRVNTAFSLPTGQLGGFHNATIQYDTTVYYGPGFDYAQHKQSLPAWTGVRCFDQENGFYIIDYQRGEPWIRGYVPAAALG